MKNYLGAHSGVRVPAFLYPRSSIPTRPDNHACPKVARVRHSGLRQGEVTPGRPRGASVPAKLLKDLRELTKVTGAGAAEAVNSGQVLIYWQV